MRPKQLKLAFTVAGTVIGAGFATGKELLLFFGNTPQSILHLVLCVLMMSAVSVLYFSQTHSDTQGKGIFSVINLIFLLFSGASYTVMLACGGEALFQSTGIFRPAGTILTYVITLGIVWLGIANVYRFNLIATPILLLCMAGISVAGLVSPVGLIEISQSATINLLSYAGYNLLSVLPVLSVLSHTVEKKDGYLGILWGFACILIVGILLKLLLLRFHTLSDQSAIPVLNIVSQIHSSFTILYTVMLYLSILTTAVNSLLATAGNKNPVPISIFLCCGSFLGFTSLIETIYPFFGYIGIGVTAILIIKSFYPSSKKGRI